MCLYCFLVFTPKYSTFGIGYSVADSCAGSQFYHSDDGKFMVKTISAAESTAMQGMLFGYARHIVEHPDTLLMRILGLFDITYHGGLLLKTLFQNKHGSTDAALHFFSS